MTALSVPGGPTLEVGVADEALVRCAHALRDVIRDADRDGTTPTEVATAMVTAFSIILEPASYDRLISWVAELALTDVLDSGPSLSRVYAAMEAAVAEVGAT